MICTYPHQFHVELRLTSLCWTIIVTTCCVNLLSTVDIYFSVVASMRRTQIMHGSYLQNYVSNFETDVASVRDNVFVRPVQRLAFKSMRFTILFERLIKCLYMFQIRSVRNQTVVLIQFYCNEYLYKKRKIIIWQHLFCPPIKFVSVLQDISFMFVHFGKATRRIRGS